MITRYELIIHRGELRGVLLAWLPAAKRLIAKTNLRQEMTQMAL